MKEGDEIMRQISELVDEHQSGWKLIQSWIIEANNRVEILPVTKSDAERVLLDLQVTTKSPMGAIAYYSGGIMVQNGWLRILGSGTDTFRRDISAWNKLNVEKQRLEGAILIADDVMGGFFAVNGGLFDGEIGNIFYLAPDTLEWEDLELKYSEFIYWAFTGDIDKFYETFRWKGWENEIDKVTGDKGILVYPFLWAEGEAIEKRSRKIVSIEELWGITMDSRKKLG